MNNLKLFPFLIRDKKWKNGYLCIMMEDFTKGKDVSQYFDYDKKWLEKIQKEMDKFYNEQDSNSITP